MLLLLLPQVARHVHRKALAMSDQSDQSDQSALAASSFLTEGSMFYVALR